MKGRDAGWLGTSTAESLRGRFWQRPRSPLPGAQVEQARFAFAQTQPLQRRPFPLALHGQQGGIASEVRAVRKAEAFFNTPQRQLDGELSKRHPSSSNRKTYVLSIWTGVFCTYYRELRTIECNRLYASVEEISGFTNRAYNPRPQAEGCMRDL